MNRNGAKKKHHIMRFIAGLPLGVLYLFSDLAYYVVYYIVRYRRRLVRENLTCSFPEKNNEEIVSIEKAFYRNLCDVFIEAFKCLNISDEEMSRRVEVVNYELPERIAAEGKNVFMLLGHCGCWEWCQEVCMRYKNPKKSAEIYKQIESPYFASLMHEIRSRWNTEQIEMTQTVRTLLRWNAAGEPFLCGFIMDQKPYVKPKDCITFLNQQTWFAPGAEEITNKMNAELVFLKVEKIQRGYYRFTFTPIEPDPEEYNKPFPLTRKFWRLLEFSIRNQPELWLWSHNRWRKYNLV